MRVIFRYIGTFLHAFLRYQRNNWKVRVERVKGIPMLTTIPYWHCAIYYAAIRQESGKDWLTHCMTNLFRWPGN